VHPKPSAEAICAVFLFHLRGVCWHNKGIPWPSAMETSPSHPKTPPTAEQWAHIVGMLASAHAGSPAAQSACTWGQTEAKRDMGLRTNLYGATQREDHAQPGVGAATPTSSSTACGRCCRGDSAAGPRYSTQILFHTKSQGRSIRRYRTLPALPGGSRQRGRYLRVPGAA
jgi:hypothetical protein